MAASVIEDLKDFVSTTAGVDRKRLSSETTLFKDLGVDGDDARELLEAFSARFGVDMSAFVFAEHFGPEAGFNPLAYLCRKLFCRGKSRLQDIRLADLERAAVTKKWS